MRWRFLALTVALAACSSPSAGPVALPQVVSSGGPVLTNASLISVTFGNDPLASDANAFVAELPASSVWTLLAEYQVGAATAATPVASTMTLKATMDESDWQAELPNELQNGLDGFPVPGGESVYVLFVPNGVTVTNQGLTGCVDFGGYHSSITLADGTPVAYAIVPRCQEFNGLNMLDSLTGVASHEIVEATTDPYQAVGKPAWSDVDAVDYAFSLAFGGGEICDLCLNSFPPFYQPSDMDYVVQRLWSNAAAAARADPCLPASDAGPFIDALPEIGTQEFDVDGTNAAVRSLSLQVGQSQEVPLQLISAPATTEPFALAVIDLSADGGSIDWSFDTDGGVAGQTVTLHLTVQSAGAQPGISGSSELIAVESSAGARIEFWPILITTPN